MTAPPFSIAGVGLGLRREFLDQLDDQHLSSIDFMEVAPENWIGLGGRYGKRLRRFTGKKPFVVHGLSLSIGGPAPLDEALVHAVSAFMDDHGIELYSEHLSYCADDGQLYDLLPIPFTRDAVDHVVDRIHRVQDLLGQQIAMENVSYYAQPATEMPEIDFLNMVLDKADCALLLDVNNIHVNAVNHGYDAIEFLRQLPGDRIAYGHIAGHHVEADDLIIDTHGAEISDPVWRLLDAAYDWFGVFPTLIERDFNIPPIDVLMAEVGQLRRIQQRHQPVAIANG